MLKNASLGIVVAWLTMSVLAAQAAGLARQTPPGATPASRRALLDTYCVTCHNQTLKTAGLNLAGMDVARPGADAEAWEKVVKKLRSGAMPPLGRPRPDLASTRALVKSLETGIDRAAVATPNPGRPVVHRLNRAEYTSAIRDLLALDVDGQALLPADESGFGFDNIADVLSLSPGLLERYLSAAQKIARLAVGDATMRPEVHTFAIPRILMQDERMSEDLPFGSRGGVAVRYQFPLDGEYIVSVRLHRAPIAGSVIGLANREEMDVRLDGARIKLFAVGGRSGRGGAPSTEPNAAYSASGDNELDVRFAAKAGPRMIGVAFRKSGAALEGLGPTNMPVRSVSFSDGNPAARMAVASIAVSGPFDGMVSDDAPSRRRIFVCRPRSGGGVVRESDQDACARTILSALARRAYRRPVTGEDIEPLLRLFRERRRDGFDAAIELALQRLLVSPQFLFRIEPEPASVAPGRVYRVGDIELASRLSFFLWSSIPDDELLVAAARGALSDPVVLERQVRRMLADARATALPRNFGGQWLHLRNMRAAAPDPHLFPEFNENLREAFARETELLIESQVKEDRSVTELLTADYTFVNEPLARYYGMPNVYGSHFRRVAILDDHRVGLLGHASLLTVTSDSTRTSPVKRGKWLLENLLGAPPPPPPPDVPALKENIVGKPAASVRARLEQHRQNPACASCHARMDPLGFALENFDAVGRWRTHDAGVPVDASGVMPDGLAFNGPRELRGALLGHREEFVATVTERLLTYALGRGTEYYDMPAVRTILREAAPSDYRWSSIILGIVRSLPFHGKRSAES